MVKKEDFRCIPKTLGTQKPRFFNNRFQSNKSKRNISLEFLSEHVITLKGKEIYIVVVVALKQKLFSFCIHKSQVYFLFLL